MQTAMKAEKPRLIIMEIMVESTSRSSSPCKNFRGKTFFASFVRMFASFLFRTDTIRVLEREWYQDGILSC